jgi:DNA mismatch endonuclease, patch repair protein
MSVSSRTGAGLSGGRMTKAQAEAAARRSRVMAAVKGKDTGPEMAVRRLLHARGHRYRLHRADLPGKPDLIFPARRKAIFVHGCFWHGHDCKRGDRRPRANGDYWRAKIARNRDRDRRNLLALGERGWRTLVVWECELKDRAALIARLEGFLRDQPEAGGP